MTKAKLLAVTMLAVTMLAVTILAGLVSAAMTDQGVARRGNSEHIVYVGTYTGESSRGIYAFRFDDSSGGLTPIGLAAEAASPSFLTSSANGRFVFAVNELQSFRGAASGSVTSFATNPVTAALTEISVQSTRGAGPCHLALDQTGRYLAVANYGGGNFALFPVGGDGRLEPATTVVAGEESPAGRSTAAARLGHMVGFDAHNRFLLAADKGLDQVLVYPFDASTGIDPGNRATSAKLPRGSGPRHFAFHPNGKWLFAINELASTITTFAWDQASGSLTAAGTVPTRPADVTIGTAAEIAVHPSGRFVYGSNRGHDSIVVFRVDGGGALTLVQHASTRGKTPRHFALDPTGRWLIAANQQSDTLAVFSIDQNTGRLSPVGPLTRVGSPVHILFM